jgi:hypothetical protein
MRADAGFLYYIRPWENTEKHFEEVENKYFPQAEKIDLLPPEHLWKMIAISHNKAWQMMKELKDLIDNCKI